MPFPWKKLIKGKVTLSTAETGREAYNWYQNKWKTDYPDLYANRWKNSDNSTMYRYGYFGPKHSGRRRLKQVGRPYSTTYGSNKRAKTVAPRTAYRKGKNVGRPVGSSTAKRVITDSNWNLNDPVGNQNVLEASNQRYEITKLPQVTTTNTIQYRQRGMINCLGFELRMHAANKASSTNLVLNVAVVAPRNQNDTLPDGFFRGYGADREQNWGAPDSMSANTLNMTPLNTDDMNVLFRGKYKLGNKGDTAPTDSNLYDQTHPSHLTLKKWIPINRQLRYENSGAASCEDPIWLCYWVCRADKSSYQSALPDIAEIKFEAIMFYKEPGTI